MHRPPASPLYTTSFSPPITLSERTSQSPSHIVYSAPQITFWKSRTLLFILHPIRTAMQLKQIAIIFGLAIQSQQSWPAISVISHLVGRFTSLPPSQFAQMNLARVTRTVTPQDAFVTISLVWVMQASLLMYMLTSRFPDMRCIYAACRLWYG